MKSFSSFLYHSFGHSLGLHVQTRFWTELIKTQSKELIAQLNELSSYPLKAHSMIASQDIPNSLENL
jgi:hypothetical protein